MTGSDVCNVAIAVFKKLAHNHLIYHPSVWRRGEGLSRLRLCSIKQTDSKRWLSTSLIQLCPIDELHVSPIEYVSYAFDTLESASVSLAAAALLLGAGADTYILNQCAGALVAPLHLLKLV